MTLAELIASDVENATRTDAEVLTWLNAAVTSHIDISWLDLSMWMATYDLRPSLIASATTGTDQLRTAAQHLLDCITAGQPLYASDARVRTTISAAIPAGTARTALVDMGRTQKARWADAGIGEVTLGQIEALRWVN